MPNPEVTITMRSGQVMKGELYPETAPQTVANFISLANRGFYDGLIFHRVIPGFMIQGGDPQGIGIGGPGYSIRGEFTANGFDGNDIAHTTGVLSMARAQHPDSAGSILPVPVRFRSPGPEPALRFPLAEAMPYKHRNRTHLQLLSAYAHHTR
jgi:hypothetical protein